jgi:hypothetical protein
MSGGQSPFDFSQYNGSQTQDQSTTLTDRSGGVTPGYVDWINQPSAFGSSIPSSGSDGLSLRIVSAPLAWLFSAFGAASVSVALASAFGAVPGAAVTAWVLGGPVAIALMAVFTLKDTKSRTFALYSASRAVPWLYRITVTVSLVAVVLSAWSIANWAGRL